MFCVKCGTENLNNSTDCVKCGSLLVMSDRQVVPSASLPDNKKKITLFYKPYPKKEIKKQLIDSYTRIHPNKEVKRMISAFEKDLKDNGCDNIPVHFGEMVADRLLEGKFPFNLAAIYDDIATAIADGATRADIIEHYDLYPIQILMVEWSEQVKKETAINFFAMEGIWSTEEILSKILRMFPIYVYPKNAQYLQGEDRRISPILRNRVNRYWASIGTGKMNAIVQSYSSFNACVRDLIRKGQI